jgi:hypothetical protein
LRATELKRVSLLEALEKARGHELIVSYRAKKTLAGAKMRWNV